MGSIWCKRNTLVATAEAHSIPRCISFCYSKYKSDVYSLEEAKASLLKEIELLAGLNHPNSKPPTSPTKMPLSFSGHSDLGSTMQCALAKSKKLHASTPCQILSGCLEV